MKSVYLFFNPALPFSFFRGCFSSFHSTAKIKINDLFINLVETLVLRAHSFIRLCLQSAERNKWQRICALPTAISKGNAEVTTPRTDTLINPRLRILAKFLVMDLRTHRM